MILVCSSNATKMIIIYLKFKFKVKGGTPKILI